ncbi:MAG: hypothetical protein K0S88_364 [Actinomycetia bacterium]|nr:hypothetical protein [Actinomycetes bacterium]
MTGRSPREQGRRERLAASRRARRFSVVSARGGSACPAFQESVTVDVSSLVRQERPPMRIGTGPTAVAGVGRSAPLSGTDQSR